MAAATPIIGRAQRYLDRNQAARLARGGQRMYQQDGRSTLQGYLNNPLEEAGRQAIAQQFLSAPLGGHVRHALQGQVIPGVNHTINNAQARMVEQGLAGALATGVGAWGLLSAIDGLSGGGPEQTPGTITIRTRYAPVYA